MNNPAKQYDWTPDGMREPPKHMGTGDWVMEEDYLAVRKIVDTLPKTADGYPIHFRQNYFTHVANIPGGQRRVVGCGVIQITEIQVDRDYSNYDVTIVDEEGDERSVSPAELFSTAEAAEADIERIQPK